VFLQGIGASAVLPLLPLYLRAHGTSDAFVGLVMGAFFVAGVLTQYGAGHLTDRLGHRTVMVAGLVAYAAGSVGFALPVGAGGYAALRALQGVGAGAVQVASLALVGLVVPAPRRGRAFSLVFAAQLAGIAIGPLAGSAAGVGHLRALFVATAVASVAATVPAVAGTAGAGLAPGEDIAALPVTRPLVGIVAVGIAAGLVTGVYESCWSLLMHSRGASAWQIGLSWTLFALPFALFSPVAGRLADRLDRRVLVVAALAGALGFAFSYPFIPAVGVLLGLAPLEAAGVAVAFPAAQSLLTDVAPRQALGRAQGVFTTAENAAIALGAAVSGAMFGVARWLPFVAAAVAGWLLLAMLPALWRGVPGHAGRTGRGLGDGELGDLHRVERGALAQVVVRDEQR
jgi:DHA1 family multidrug resistance protein-like MFS transporter